MHSGLKKIILASLALALVAIPVFAASNITYTLLVQDVPFVSNVGNGGLAGYLQAFFSLGIAIAVMLAVILFVYNGVLYMTSDVTGTKSQAKSAFLNILGGLLLVVGSWVVLNTINPDLVNFNLFNTLNRISNIKGTGGGGSSSGGGISAAGCAKCEPVPGSLTLKTDCGGQQCVLDPTFAGKLAALSSLVDVTEAYPTTYPHDDPCHQTGTCADTVVKGVQYPAVATGAQVQQIVTASTQQGMRATYEVLNQTQKDDLVAGGANPANISINPKASAPHFHIEYP